MIFTLVIHFMLFLGSAFSQSPTTTPTPTTTVATSNPQDACYSCTSPCPTQTPSGRYVVSSALCSDQRLGPTALPSHTLINSMLTNYHPLGRECPQGYFDIWVNYTGSVTYPPLEGFKLFPNGTQIFSRATIPNNTYIDRFGNPNGTYVSPAGTPYEQRSIPPSNLVRRGENGTVYGRFLTLTEIEVENGTIAPWYGQPGGGIQYILPYATHDLLQEPRKWLAEAGEV